MRSLALAIAIAATGCYDPDVGAALTPRVDSGADIGDAGDVNSRGCDDDDSDPTVAVSFSQHVRPLLTRTPGGCAPCHQGRVTSGLDQSSYQSLRRGGLISGTRIVVAGEPCSSVFYQKIGRTPPFGSRMPYNGPPYFTAEERLIVHDWIAEGAANN